MKYYQGWLLTLIIFCVKDASLEAVVGKNPNKFNLSGEIECIGVNIMRVLPFDNTKSSMSASELVEEISKKGTETGTNRYIKRDISTG